MSTTVCQIMFILVLKRGLWAVLVLELLCFLLLPTNGRPSFEDIESGDENQDKQEEFHQDDFQDEDLDDEEDEEKNENIGPTEDDGKEHPCNSEKFKNGDKKCKQTLECCLTAECQQSQNLDGPTCQAILKSWYTALAP